MKILDSSPVIAFYTELNEPDMLHKFIELGYELRIPRSVFKEIENGRTSEPLKSNISTSLIFTPILFNPGQPKPIYRLPSPPYGLKTTTLHLYSKN
jgi:hypothetical protein